MAAAVPAFPRVTLCAPQPVIAGSNDATQQQLSGQWAAAASPPPPPPQPPRHPHRHHTAASTLLGTPLSLNDPDPDPDPADLGTSQLTSATATTTSAAATAAAAATRHAAAAAAVGHADVVYPQTGHYYSWCKHTLVEVLARHGRYVAAAPPLAAAEGAAGVEVVAAAALAEAARGPGASEAGAGVAAGPPRGPTLRMSLMAAGERAAGRGTGLHARTHNLNLNPPTAQCRPWPAPRLGQMLFHGAPAARCHRVFTAITSLVDLSRPCYFPSVATHLYAC